MAEWDKERRTHEQTSGDRLSLQEIEIDALRRALKKGEGDSNSVNRTLKGLGDGLAACRQEAQQLRNYVVEKTDNNRDKVAKLRDEFEQRTTLVENQQHQLQDRQASTDSFVHQMSEKVAATCKRVHEAHENIADIWRSKASVGNLEETQKDLAEFMRQIGMTVSSLHTQLYTLVEDVKSHFQEASAVVAVTTSRELDALRQQHKQELQRMDVVMEDVKSFVSSSTNEQKGIRAEVVHVHDDANQNIDRLQKSVEDFEKRRIVGDNNAAVELAQLRKNIADIQAVMQNQKEMSTVRGDTMDLLVESQLLSALCELQDDNDRRNISLYGFKGADGGKEKSEKSGVLPDVHHGGSQSARGQRKKAAGPNAGCSASGMGQVLSLDKRCLSCSGSQETVLAGFKLACLSYAPSQIEIEHATYSRSELINQRVDMLKHAKDQLRSRSIE
jgi:hypothetical protein